MTIDKLHVVTMVSNPVRYESRYRLYRQFADHCERSGVQLWTCEIAHGSRPHEVTSASHPRHLQLRTTHELWHKERALNLLVHHLSARCPDWRYLVWSDCDLEWPRWQGPHSWWRETWQALQHHQVVQCFQHAVDLGPSGEHLHTHTGFAYSYVTGRPYKSGYVDWHPGFCWGARREAYEATPLVDIGVLGSGDRHMACGWVGQVSQSLNNSCSPGYKRALAVWQEQAERYVRRDLGFVPGLVLHHWHGRKALRQYQSRWQVLVDSQYDPATDIKPDSYGLWQLVDHGTPRSLLLRDGVRKVFRGRNEDSIDLE